MISARFPGLCQIVHAWLGSSECKWTLLFLCSLLTFSSSCLETQPFASAQRRHSVWYQSRLHPCWLHANSTPWRYGCSCIFHCCSFCVSHLALHSLSLLNLANALEKLMLFPPITASISPKNGKSTGMSSPSNSLHLCHFFLVCSRLHYTSFQSLYFSPLLLHCTTSTVVSTAGLPGPWSDGIVLKRASFTAVGTALLIASLMLWLPIMLNSKPCGRYKVKLKSSCVSHAHHTTSKWPTCDHCQCHEPQD